MRAIWTEPSLRALLNNVGSGASIDVTRPFLLVIFHPTTTEYGVERREMEELLHALDCTRMQTILLWPNIDAGADHISKAIRIFRDQNTQSWLRALTNLSPENYLKVLSNAACAIGNSSSFVRDASYFGTPVVLVGARQDGREIDAHVVPVRLNRDEIFRGIRSQLEHGRYRPSVLYGDGNVSDRISQALAQLDPYVQKRLHYIYDGVNGCNGKLPPQNLPLDSTQNDSTVVPTPYDLIE